MNGNGSSQFRRKRARIYFMLGTFFHIGTFISYFGIFVLPTPEAYVLALALLGVGNLLLLKSFQIVLSTFEDTPTEFQYFA